MLVAKQHLLALTIFAPPFSSPPLQFCAIVNINLAVVNMLPLPALDGGYLAILLLEAVRGGQKLPEKVCALSNLCAAALWAAVCVE